MGDLICALPIMRALARIHGGKINLITSPLCWQLAPLLWEQPYIESCTLDDAGPYELQGGIVNRWNYFLAGGGINLSPQPRFYAPGAPISYTDCYKQVAGVEALLPEDTVVLPSLVNHRRWHFGFEVVRDGVRQQTPPTVILAPESETLERIAPVPLLVWKEIAYTLGDAFQIVIVGQKRNHDWIGTPNTLDLRGLTTVSSLARLIAEARGFFGPLSLPWHLARFCEMPCICVQEIPLTLIRSMPTDSEYLWATPSDVKHAIRRMQDLMAAEPFKLQQAA